MSLNILIVEDEAITALDIKKKLEQWGYNVPNIAHTGSEAIQFAKEVVPDLILMDIILKGDMDGIKTAGEIKKKLDIPLIYLTAHSEDKIMERAKYTEPYGYLIKPLDEKELRFALDSAIYKHKTDKKLKKTNRALKMISDCNQAIVRTKDEDVVLNQICKLIVEEGNYKLVWIGMAQNDEFKSIKPIAEFGFDDGYLKSLKISWDDNKYGQSPVGKAIRKSKIFISRNIPEDPNFVAWRERAVKRGYNSSAALPLYIERKVIGSLNIYSSETDSFDHDELELLEELSLDISFFLESQKVRSERYNALEKIKINETRYRELFESLKSGVSVYKAVDDGNDFVFSEFNAAAESIEDISREEVIGRRVTEVFPGVKEFKLLETFKEVWKTGQSQKHPIFHYKDKRIEGWRDNYVYKLPSGEIVAVYDDVTEKKQAEEALIKSEKKYHELFDLSPQYNILLSTDGKLLDVNKAAQKFTGLSREELIGKNFKDLSIFPPEEMDLYKESVSQLIEGKTVKATESRIIDKNGNTHWIETLWEALIEDKDIFAIQIISHDVTDRKTAENHVKKALEEKKILLSEIHHRVKNNMQIISSLLNLQNSYLNDEKDLELFIESQNRVKSMALIHEKLYRSKDLVKIDFADYVRDLAYYLFYSYIDDPERVKIDFNIEKVNLNIETAIPCGIIINELVTNSLKHAFNPGATGKITLELHQEQDEFLLIIKDNGKGFPDDIDFRNTETLGMRLVMNLVNQIDGTIELDNTKGAEFKIKFKELFYETRL